MYKKFVELSSHSIGGNKVILISNAESLTVNAANALLKILEEPPGKLVFDINSSEYFKPITYHYKSVCNV